MKQKLTLTVLFLGIIYFSNAQEAKKLNIAIPGFQISNDSRIPKQTVTAIEQNVIDVFVKNKKFVVLERSQLGQLRNETDLQKQETFMDGEGNISDQWKNAGANYLVTGIVSNLAYNSERLSLIHI